MVKTYKLSPAAVLSIEAIVAYTDEAFGANQTAAYIVGLQSNFDLLVRFPGSGAAAFEVKARLRRYRYQSHYIFYTEQDEPIRIEDIVHVGRSIRPDLFDT
ncbi:type II toxin-antitoxin system RelE/ParE family toxin [Xanthobacteraceae bacterium Astr-EGSB]|uniref:type II toxin-antitoxin system RelE/ParE family toxin n=1 Tax=Astrobacterium formosum TaxID=3069710 RepID=UPI0027B38A86|nr:type II toxin-antitoxin system RelE/ParE family toxin [Xanthobacteraceae bacterium Astr-EGSB]